MQSKQNLTFSETSSQAASCMILATSLTHISTRIQNELETVSYTQVRKPISHLSAHGSACPAQLQPQTAGFLSASHYTERVCERVCLLLNAQE